LNVSSPVKVKIKKKEKVKDVFKKNTFPNNWNLVRIGRRFAIIL